MSCMTDNVLLEVVGVSKSYPGVKALSDVHITVHAGEVHALLGENGAGKSTLIKIISGAERADSGRILLAGNEVHFADTYAARVAGISTVFQEFTLIPDLSIAENILVHQDSAYKRGWLLDRRGIERRVVRLFERLGISGTVDPRVKVRSISVAQQQLVEIAKAVALEARLIILDEPTATLSPQEAQLLFKIVRDLANQGIGFIFVTHRLEEVHEIATTVSVLRDGQNILSRVPASEIAMADIIRAMVGRDIEKYYVRNHVTAGDQPVLSVRGICRGTKLHDISFDVYPGEIVGIAGLVGSGRTELLRAIFGAEPPDQGEIQVEGKRTTPHSPGDAIANGIAMVPEDRKQHGLLLDQTVRQNINLSRISMAGRWLLDRRDESKQAVGMVEKLAIRTSSIETRARSLSGGNQQKVVVGKWLLNEPKVLLLDEPTRGIDVGAKAGIYALINQLTATGIGVVMVSSELPELLGVADRILVMREGWLSADLPRAEATEEIIMEYATPRSKGPRRQDDKRNNS